MVDNSERRELAIRAAWLYHERGFTQQAVADRLGISRSTISRLLADAERDGIVRVTVTEPLPETARLAEDLIERYDLEAATVEISLDRGAAMDAAATAMARRLEHMVTGGPITIAAGWGRTLSRSAQLTRKTHTTEVVIVDAFGHTTTDEFTSAVEVTNTLGSKFGARVMHMPSPGFAATAEIAHNFLESEPVCRAMERARAADAILVSVGVASDQSLLLAEGLLTQSKMKGIVAAGGVGEVFGRYYDAAGDAVEPQALHPVSLTLDDLRAARRVIAVAGGSEKAAAIKGALAAGIVNELAVDDGLAEILLA
ncbi:MAG: sugar-binding domain-containing protein [Actinomycetota bacterium]|nr:sugar-binding domain-containing protein [Actinomycetota bacterium]